MAMLGLLHRQVLGKGPAALGKFIKLSNVRPARHTRLSANRHRLQLESRISGGEQDYLKRSILGAIEIYNLLPAGIVESADTVKKFQSMLQDMVKDRACAHCPDWRATFCPRTPIHCHPLLAALL